MKRKYLFGHISFNWFEFVLEICKHWPLVTAVDHPQAYCDVFRVVLHVVSVQHLLVTFFLDRVKQTTLNAGLNRAYRRGSWKSDGLCIVKNKNKKTTTTTTRKQVSRQHPLHFPLPLIIFELLFTVIFLQPSGNFN